MCYILKVKIISKFLLPILREIFTDHKLLKKINYTPRNCCNSFKMKPTSYIPPDVTKSQINIDFELYGYFYLD